MTQHTVHTIEGPMNRGEPWRMDAWHRIVAMDGSTVSFTPDHNTARIHAAAPAMLEVLRSVENANLERFCECDNTHAACNTVCRPCFIAQKVRAVLATIDKGE